MASLSLVEITDGDWFTVNGLRGKFVCRGFNADGSVRCFGGTTGRERWRSFPTDRVSKILKPLPSKACAG
ncbi:hypothetical protein UFOVP278_13 [uncultured Caudovirales phage]|uniref:Uncharacterized protein n=1 Tax=uncultured Caudovirales phage TaxID=2100421 RepID=A0A6J5LSW0_9CAUD|nr:hypothetical protein UFOVP278_13 [uncultured Caudovirales phage]